jgi:hypothetical protein
MTFEIYKIARPTIDNAVYYGQHCLQKRGGSHYMGSGKNILASLKQYGRKAHKKEQLFVVYTQEEADEKEKQTIQTAISNGENLLNQDYGGQKTRNMSEETRKILSLSHKGQNKGIPRSAETRAKISASHIGIGKGKKLTAAHREKLIASLTGRTVTDNTREKLRNTNRSIPQLEKEGAKPVINLDTGKEYLSISEASRETGICISSIARCAKGQWASALGTRWAYAQ